MLPKWETLVQQIHNVTTTASFFARYCFIRALAEDPTFDLHVHFEKPIFFTEAMKTFVDKPRGEYSTDETRMVRETIDRYLADFRNHYQYEKQKIPGLQSNLFQYTAENLETIKWRLNKALRDVNMLPKWETLVQQVHKITTTASFFLLYC